MSEQAVTAAAPEPALTPELLGQILASYLKVFPHETEELQQLVAQIADKDSQLFTRSNMRGHVCCSALVLNEAQDKVLFIHHKAMNFWMQPGGHYENDPSLLDGALREVQEETGLSNLQLHPWHLVRAVPFDIHTHPIAARPEKNEGEHFHHDHIFLLIGKEADLMLQVEEIEAAKWIPLAELAGYPGLRLRDRFIPKLKMIGLL